jgi:hypothetical protein
MYTGRYYPGPAADNNLGDLTPAAQLQLLQGYRELLIAANQAAAMGDADTAAIWRDQAEAVRQQYLNAGGSSEQLTTVDKAVLAVGNAVSTTVGGIGSGLSTLLQPLIVPGLIVLAALWLWKKK